MIHNLFLDTMYILPSIYNYDMVYILIFPEAVVISWNVKQNYFGGLDFDQSLSGMKKRESFIRHFFIPVSYKFQQV